MSEQQQTGRTTTGQDDGEQAASLAVTSASSRAGGDAGFDALLDEIDALLEDNAADYVRSFVQKGGQ